MLRLLIISLFLLPALQAQTNPIAAQFDYLMNQPKSIVNALATYPHLPAAPDSFRGFHVAAPPVQLRIASIQRPVDSAAAWKHWESDDSAAWIDVIHFPHASDANAMLDSAHQPHSGYIWSNQLLLFSGTGDRTREAVGAALVNADGSLLNLGMKLPLEVHWDRPLPPADRAAFDTALAKFKTTLDLLARAFLDPTYVAFEPELGPKPEALPILRTAGFARLWSTIKYNFVYLDQRPNVNWDSVLDQYMPQIAAAKDDIAYGRLLEQAVALLHDGHTNVYPNSVAPHDAPLIQLEPIQGKPVATAVGTLPELAAIHPGMQLQEIDGVPVATIIQRDLDPYISSSTIQDRQLRQMRALLDGPPGSQLHTKWLTLDGNTVEIALTRNASKNRAALKLPSHDLIEQKDLPGGIAYIALNDFSNRDIVSRFEQQYDKLRAAKAWIIDLRYNGGGSSDIGNSILAHLLPEAALGSTWRTRQYNPTFEAWGRPQVWYEGSPDKIEPAAGLHYDGPVYVLTSPSTCSAAEDFLIPLVTAKRITIVGEPTCCSSGQPLVFSIYGATARVCTKWDQFLDGKQFVGVGILPDVPASRTRQDVSSSRDPVLETAVGRVP